MKNLNIVRRPEEGRAGDARYTKSIYAVLCHSIVRSLLLLCKGQISLLCSLRRNSRLAINLVYGAQDRGLDHGNDMDARRLRLHLTPKGDKKPCKGD